MLLDQLDRPLRNLRLSVTDRCNLRCQYCMPEMEYVWLPREDMLHFEEINRLVDVFMSLGVNHIRLTGGEPLLRRDLSTLVDMLAAKEGLNDLALTSNGIPQDHLVAKGYGPDTPVRELMTDDLVIVRISDDIEDAASKMSDAQVRRLPVIDDQECLCGIVSLGDLSRESDEDTAAEALAGVSQPGGEHRQ